VTYSRPTTGTGMPLQERFGARPMWACLVACPVHEITSFVVDSSRSRKSVFQLFKSHTSFSGHPRIEGTCQVIMQAAIFAHFQARPVQRLHPQHGGQQTLAARRSGERPIRRAKRRATLPGPLSVMPLARRRGKRHASHAPASLQSEVSRSVPSPDHAPGDDQMNFSQGVVPCACRV